MKRFTVTLCALLALGFALSAAVEVTADDLAAGPLSEDVTLGDAGVVVGTGNVLVDVSTDPAYAQVLTLTGDSAITLNAKQGETLTLAAAPDATTGEASVVLSSDAGTSEVLSGVSADGSPVTVEYSFPADGVYTLAANPEQALSVYQVTVA